MAHCWHHSRSCRQKSDLPGSDFVVIDGSRESVGQSRHQAFFRRQRPTVKGDARFKIRKPRTSSFPSGHASSAFFAAVVLSRWSTWPAIALWFAFALTVATSRVAVRIHHASDIFAGALIGAAMGVIARIVLNLL